MGVKWVKCGSSYSSVLKSTWSENVEVLKKLWNWWKCNKKKTTSHSGGLKLSWSTQEKPEEYLQYRVLFNIDVLIKIILIITENYPADNWWLIRWWLGSLIFINRFNLKSVLPSYRNQWIMTIQIIRLGCFWWEHQSQGYGQAILDFSKCSAKFFFFFF